jgi:hypothetical protein
MKRKGKNYIYNVPADTAKYASNLYIRLNFLQKSYKKGNHFMAPTTIL